MEIIKFLQTNKFTDALPTLIWEYKLVDNSMNAAVAEIKGRYPSEGFVLNEISKELVYVIKGSGLVYVDGKRAVLEIGDFLIIEPNEKYFYEGDISLLLINIPKWTQEQHKFVN